MPGGGILFRDPIDIYQQNAASLLLNGEAQGGDVGIYIPGVTETCSSESGEIIGVNGEAVYGSRVLEEKYGEGPQKGVVEAKATDGIRAF